MARWTLTDPYTLEVLTFVINPSEGGEPSREKTVGYAQAKRGGNIIYEGRDKVPEITWKGVILDTSQRDTFITWWDKRTPLTLTNDLGESYTIYIDKFTPVRKRVASRPYKADYDVHALLVT